MKAMTLSTRIDEPTKIAFSQVCENVGLSTSQALQIFAKAVVNYGGIPFELKMSNDTKIAQPNAITIKAMQELQTGKGQRAENFADFLTDMDVSKSDKVKILAGLT